uniref:Uncharacterized protein n=1 Tax=Mimivirus LCMiAC01 TaxID=2506608 RepID=A0A481YZR1_9VIRU|nr:MAG: hypothetical protein LCMiAC01_00650 [Mimivirus LCMiAC01]
MYFITLLIKEARDTMGKKDDTITKMKLVSLDHIWNFMLNITNLGKYSEPILTLFMSVEFISTLLYLFGVLVRVVWYVNHTADAHLAFRLDVIYFVIDFILTALIFCDWYTKYINKRYTIKDEMNDLYTKFLSWNIIIAIALGGLYIYNMLASLLYRWFIGGLN